MSETLERKAINKILEWVDEQPHWIKSALNLVSSKSELNEADYESLYSTWFNGPTDKISTLVDEQLVSPGQHNETVNLLNIKNVTNVNALASSQTLSFPKDSMTIVYGDNGSGKSGYVRLLKKACRALDVEEILPNIYRSNGDEQFATITFSVDEAVQEYSWTNKAFPSAKLGAISVFDSKCAYIHVNQPNSIAYSPYPLQLLEKLAVCVKKINERVDNEIKLLASQTPDILKRPPIDPKTQVGKALATLDKLTKEDLTELSNLTAEDATKLHNFEEDLKSDPAIQIKKLNIKLEKLKEYAQKFKEIDQLVSAENIQGVNTCIKLLDEKRKASAIAAQTLNDVSKLPDVGTDVWKHLWESARNYSQQKGYPTNNFPVIDNNALCVLCQQPLDMESKERLARFDEFVKSELEEEIAILSNKYNNHKNNLKSMYDSFFVCEAFNFLKYEVDSPVLADKIKSYLIQLKWNLRKVLRNFVSLGNVNIIYPKKHHSELENEIHTISNRINSLSAPDVKQRNNKIKQEFSELKAKKWLSEHYNDVVLEIERKFKTENLKKWRFNTKSITDKSKEIAGELVSNTLRGNFLQEVDKLELAGIAVEVSQAKSEQGVPYFQITFIHKPDKQISNVLSEGEHRCVALAIFLAELNCSGNKSTIIFDDPVSSLDHNHRENIARRLVEESQKRQLIIFTHDISFLFTLIEEYKHTYGNEPAVKGVTRNSDQTGFCNNEPPLKVQTVSKRITSLEKHFENVKAHYEEGRAADWERESKSLARDLREVWELAVEEILSPAIKRFSNKLETRGIFRISVLAEEDCKMMRQAYKRCAELCHADSAARNPKIPTPDFINYEIQLINKWYSEIKDKQNRVNEF